MEISRADAQYIVNCIDFLITLPSPQDRRMLNLSADMQLSSRCGECGDIIDAENTAGHATYTDRFERLFVVIGCEGYWQINPTLVGMTSPNWQPDRETLGEADAGRHF